MLEPETLISRSNYGSLIPSNLPDDFMRTSLETMVWWHGQDLVLQVIGELEDALDGDYDVSESSLSYACMFSDRSELMANELMQKEFLEKIINIDTDEVGSLFVRQRQRKGEIDPSLTVQDFSRDATGKARYKITAIDGSNPVWVEAPAGRPDLAGEAYLKANKTSTISELAETLESGYDIPRSVVPILTKPDAEDYQFQEHHETLKGSRYLRQLYPHASKSMVTPDGSTAGTYWKFDPIARYVHQVKSDCDNILICGSGRSGNTGMCISIQSYFPKARVTVYDPRAEPDLFPPHWKVVNAVFDESSEPGNEFDLVFTDVAIGDGAQFDEKYVVAFATMVCTRYPKTLCVFKDSVRNICHRGCLKIFFGRGHNAEMFVVKRGKGKFVSTMQARKIELAKLKCDLARNLKHCAGVTVKRNSPLELPSPLPPRSGSKAVKCWSKNRLHSRSYTMAEFNRVLCGLSVKDHDPNDPVTLIVEISRFLYFVAPDTMIYEDPDTNIGRLAHRIRLKLGGSKYKNMKDRMARSNKNKRPSERRKDAKKRGPKLQEYLENEVVKVAGRQAELDTLAEEYEDYQRNMVKVLRA